MQDSNLDVCCNGNEETDAAHPLVYLKIDLKIGAVICPYCSKKFTTRKKDNQKL